jgi:hypothetical protein
MNESDIESFYFIEISRIDPTKTIVILWSLMVYIPDMVVSIIRARMIKIILTQ